ncbi:MAG: HAMP domain-containing sensor histidine kinase [Candidatus Gracilibacteria bacterium]|nr:HAMP domain-containing sensor histidine kinase [Candidatus Gracilibacteria bacterium]
MKLSISIPLNIVVVLMLTLLLNVVGLKFSFEAHFPTYIAETRDQLQPNTALNPEGLQALFSINSLDGETKADYQKALSELSNLSSSLKSLSENPELYVIEGKNSGQNSPNSFHIYAYNDIVEKATGNALFKVFQHPFDINLNAPDGKFMLAIIKNFLILNVAWMMIIILVYMFWLRRIFRPIHLIIDTLKNFSVTKTSKIFYKKNDEFLPLITTLNELSTSLGQQEKIRNQFLSDLSHEIRTPMTAISVLLEAIDDGVMELDKSTILTLQSEMRRLVEITEHIMKGENFLSQNADEIVRQKVFLKPMAQEIILQYQPTNQKNHQKILENFPENAYIFANREQLVQVLHNIFSNFCKYAGENATLECSFKTQKTFNVLTFSDDGTGVSDEELPFLAEKFYKSDTGRTQNSDEMSMGIGLSLVSKITSLHGGSMRLESTKPHGLTLILTFGKNE